MRYVPWTLLFLWLCGFGLHCLPLEERACRNAADCALSEGKLHCLRGVCSQQECEAGVIAPCFQANSKLELVGICRAGQRLCLEQGVWSRCEGQILPQREICDRLDNDCDGTIDQAAGLQCDCLPGSKRECYAGPEGTQGKGICRAGIQYCERDHRWGRCFAQQVPIDEICDQLDNNCNGSIDEGLVCSCTAGTTRPCFQGSSRSRNQGRCRDGTQRCQPDGRWGKCEGEILAEPEVCDGIDNDCDGVVDGDVLDCSGLTRCIQGQCRCPAPLLACGQTCIDPQQNQQHCGTCGNSCPLGSTCQTATCQCPGQQKLCGGKCVDVSSEGAHCGQCNNACTTGQLCRDGRCSACLDANRTCGAVCCPSPRQCCNQTCVDVSTSKQHCGACDKSCQAGDICCSGACIKENEANCGICGKTCDTGQVCCQGQCVDIKQNQLHCGACGSACATGKTCCQGQCVAVSSELAHCGVCGHACSALQSCCSGICVDGVSTNSSHCGACGVRCSPEKPVCCGGTCVEALATNAQHCGACGKSCTPGQSCCAGICVDLQSSPSHCGTCGTSCTVGAVCCAKQCYEGICPITTTISNKVLNASQWVKGVKIARSPQGDIYVAGVFQGDFSITCAGKSLQFSSTKHRTTGDPTQDFFVARFSDFFTCQWIRVGGSDEHNELYDMKLLRKAGNDILYVVGSSGASATFLQFDTQKTIYTGGLKAQTSFLVLVGGNGAVSNILTPSDSELSLYALSVDSTGTFLAIAGEAKGTVEFNRHVATPIKLVPQSTSQFQAVVILWTLANDQIKWADGWSVSGKSGRFRFTDVAFAEKEKKIYATGDEGPTASESLGVIRRYDAASGVSDGLGLMDPGALRLSRGVRLILEPIVPPPNRDTRVFVAMETSLQTGLWGGNRAALGLFQTSLWNSEWSLNSLPDASFMDVDFPNTRPRAMSFASQGQIMLGGDFAEVSPNSTISRGIYLGLLSSKRSLQAFRKFPSSDQAVLADMLLDNKDYVYAVGWFSGQLDLPPTAIRSVGGISLWMWRYAFVP